RQGKAFCDAVVAARGQEGLDHVWDDPAMLPTSEELAEPSRWLVRLAARDVAEGRDTALPEVDFEVPAARGRRAEGCRPDPGNRRVTLKLALRLEGRARNPGAARPPPRGNRNPVRSHLWDSAVRAGQRPVAGGAAQAVHRRVHSWGSPVPV